MSFIIIEAKISILIPKIIIGFHFMLEHKNPFSLPIRTNFRLIRYQLRSRWVVLLRLYILCLFSIRVINLACYRLRPPFLEWRKFIPRTRLCSQFFKHIITVLLTTMLRIQLRLLKALIALMLRIVLNLNLTDSYAEDF